MSEDERNWNVNLRNGTINYGLTAEVGTQTVFHYGQFIEQLNFGDARPVLPLGGTNGGSNGSPNESDLVLGMGTDVVLKSDTAAMYLSEYSMDGDLVCADKLLDYDACREDLPYGQITIDPNNLVHHSLRFTGSLILNNGRQVSDFMGKDLIFKTDQHKTVTWHSQLMGAINQTVNTKADQCGNLYVVGSYNDQLLYNGQSVLSTVMESNVFLLKINPSGKLLWAIGADDAPCKNTCSRCRNNKTNTTNCSSCRSNQPHEFDTNHVDGQTVTVTLQNQNPIIVGSYTNHVTFKGQSLFNPTSRANAYVAEFTCDGNFVSLNGPRHCPLNLETSSLDSSGDFLLGESIDVDTEDNVYVTGTIRGRYVFEDALQPSRQTLLEIANPNIYVTKIRRKQLLGDFEWSRLILAQVPPASSFYPNIDVLPSGRIYVAGQATGLVHFLDTQDVIDETHTINLPGRLYLFSSALNQDGIWQWTAPETATINNASEHISSNNSGAHVAGTFIVNQTQSNPFVSQLDA